MAINGANKKSPNVEINDLILSVEPLDEGGGGILFGCGLLVSLGGCIPTNYTLAIKIYRFLV